MIGANDIGDRDVGLSDVGQVGGLLGESRVGKSSVCAFYRSLWPKRVTEDGERFPVIYVPMSSDMKVDSLAQEIYLATGAGSVPGGMKTAAVIRNCIRRLVTFETELLIIDDAQYLFYNRTKTDLNNFLSFLKLVADAKTANVLLVGEEKVEKAVMSYNYLYGRGAFPHKNLRPMGDSTTEFELFRMLMNKVDARLPFRELSDLQNPAIAGDLYRYSNGMIGLVMAIVGQAAKRAISSGTSRIMLEHLYEEAALRPKPNDDYEYFRRAKP